MPKPKPVAPTVTPTTGPATYTVSPGQSIAEAWAKTRQPIFVWADCQTFLEWLSATPACTNCHNTGYTLREDGSRSETRCPVGCGVGS